MQRQICPYRPALRGPCKHTWRKPLDSFYSKYSIYCECTKSAAYHLAFSLLGEGSGNPSLQEIPPFHLIGEPCCHSPRYGFRSLKAKLSPRKVIFLSVLIPGLNSILLFFGPLNQRTQKGEMPTCVLSVETL